MPETGTISVLFDRVNYDPSVNAEEHEAIWNFFDSLGLDTDVASAATEGDDIVLAKDVDIPFADLMNAVSGNRWTYSGSETAPPCTIGVLYQVMERVLPISEKHYKALLDN